MVGGYENMKMKKRGKRRGVKTEVRGEGDGNEKKW